MTRIVVDLPGPVRADETGDLPGRTLNVIPSSASVGPNRLRRPVTSMVGSMPGRLDTAAQLVVPPGAVFRVAGRRDLHHRRSPVQGMPWMPSPGHARNRPASEDNGQREPDS